MFLKLPKKFAKEPVVLKHIRDVSLFESIVYYVINSNFRRSVNLQSWLNNQLDESTLEELKSFPLLLKDDDSNFSKCRKVLDFVHQYLVYKKDRDVWNAFERWQSIFETIDLKTGDCEDGAILIYSILIAVGVPDYQLRIVAGNVDGGGHAYVVWLSDDDGLEYPIDWCYLYFKSKIMIYPYVEREEYFFGSSEWFSFNREKSYRCKK